MSTIVNTVASSPFENLVTYHVDPASGWVRKLPEYSASDFFAKRLEIAGAVFNGTSDDAAAISEAAAVVNYQGKLAHVQFPDGVSVIKNNTGITIPFSCLSIDFCGIPVDCSGMTTGAALSLVGQSVSPYNIRSNTNSIKSLVLLGPDNDSSVVDGIRIGGVDATFPGHGAFEDIFVSGFRDNLVAGSNYFISTFRNAHLLNGHRSNVNFVATTNAGESITFFGGSLSDASNSGETAVALLVPDTGPGPDMQFFGTSFSYNDIAFDVAAGTINFTGAHFENKTNNPMGKITTTGGKPSTAVVISGGSLVHGSLGSGVETSGGRPYMFLVNSTAGDRCSFIMRGTRYGGYGKKNTEIVRFTGSSYPEIVIEDIIGEAQGNTLGRVSGFTNRLYNGGFETGKTNGWTNSDGTNTVTQDATVFSNGAESEGGAKSLKVVGASAGTTVYSQTIPVRPGKKLRVRGSVRCDTFTAGLLTIKAYLLDNTGATITTYTVGSLASANAAWALYGNDYRITAGVVSAKIEIAATGFTGTGYFDDIAVWEI